MAASERTFRAADETLVTVFLSDSAAVELLRTGLVLVEPGEEEERLPNYQKNISDAVTPGTPVAGALEEATEEGAALSATSVPCKEVMVFPSSAEADTFIGDANSQTCRLPSMPLTFHVDDVAKLYGRLSEGTGSIPWLAITTEEEEEA